MLWLNFLHFYQPANADKKNFLEAVTNNYERIVRGLEENNQIKFTVNLSGCLLMRLDHEFKRIDLIRRIKRLVLKKQLELVGSAAYHPILPLIGQQQAYDQILENKKILSNYFGDNIKIRGFFLPEMAYSQESAKLIKSFGYEWIILDEIQANGKLNQIDHSQIFKDKNSDLDVIFRNREFSQTYIPATLLNKKYNDDQVIVSATDAELYGLRHIDEPADFEKLLKNTEALNIKTALISDYIDSAKNKKNIKVIPSSWESTEEELIQKNSYNLWYNKNNKIQKQLWELANFSQAMFYKHQTDKNSWWSQWHLVRGLASCTFWWSSGRDLTKVFGPIAWNPDQIELGAQELARSVRCLESSTSLEEKLLTEKKLNNVIKNVWNEHWTKYKIIN
ncbi:MAG: hypothetical protein NT091_03300 [Candidatus Falkowbacteria bacterium]|nr:hypothetical protein [Candidatus Falkowbacteria bacterium]